MTGWILHAVTLEAFEQRGAITESVRLVSSLKFTRLEAASIGGAWLGLWVCTAGIYRR
jgi:hypothetical protein